ncbi:MAG: ABC transporter permease, partial [Elusimicrobia bacterium]|nr:ABC transporter permease [Elusimicrobiota bacterium]
KRVPGLASALELLAGRIDEKTMRRLNYEVDEDKRAPRQVARQFLLRQGLLGSRLPRSGPAVVIASKAFTESVILGELMAQLVETRLGVRVQRRFNLGGTMIVHNALKDGDIDVYAEYTGTALTAILGLQGGVDAAAAYEIVSREYPLRFNCRWLKPFGFNNTYALGVREADALAHGWRTISDLTRR